MTTVGESDSLNLKVSQQRGATQNIPGSFLSVGCDFQEGRIGDGNVNINRSKNCPNDGEHIIYLYLKPLNY